MPKEYGSFLADSISSFSESSGLSMQIPEAGIIVDIVSIINHNVKLEKSCIKYLLPRFCVITIPKRKNYMTRLLAVILLFADTFLNVFASGNQSGVIHRREIFLIKTEWHVGIVFLVDSLSINILPNGEMLKNFRLIDIGWGDEDFYQSDDINYLFALKAALLPTSSVLKFTGYSGDINRLVTWSDFTIKLNLTGENFTKMLNFIEDSFYYENEKIVETSSKAEGVITFYKSSYSYSLAYTCNSWIADALLHAGLPVNPAEIITSDQLYAAVAGLGEILK